MAVKQKQADYTPDQEVDEAFNNNVTKVIRKNKAKKTERWNTALKYGRLLHIALLILATILLGQQDFLYAQVLGVVVGLSTLERVWFLVFAGK